MRFLDPGNFKSPFQREFLFSNPKVIQVIQVIGEYSNDCNPEAISIRNCLSHLSRPLKAVIFLYENLRSCILIIFVCFVIIMCGSESWHCSFRACKKTTMCELEETGRFTLSRLDDQLNIKDETGTAQTFQNLTLFFWRFAMPLCKIAVFWEKTASHFSRLIFQRCCYGWEAPTFLGERLQPEVECFPLTHSEAIISYSLAQTRRTFNFRFPSVEHKRLFLSSLMSRAVTFL